MVKRDLLCFCARSMRAPPIWLLIFIAGLPQLSETVYTPSLTKVAQTLRVTDAMAEYTLTIYLFGFALGVFFWGKVSDRIGRKPCILAGLVIFCLGCLGCYSSASIFGLMLSRFVQALGGSIGSVLAQAIVRDAFDGPALGRVYSSVGSALSLFPAFGPVFGGLVVEYFPWSTVFLFLMVAAVVLMGLVFFKLPETLRASQTSLSTWAMAKTLFQNKKVIAFGLIVGACNGISFCYFAEGPFYLMKGLGLSSSAYGLSFIGIGLSAVLGGLFSRKLHLTHAPQVIMHFGLVVVAISSAFFTAGAFLNHIFPLSTVTMIGITLISQMAISFGCCVAAINALALSLADYKYCIGTASSLFGLFYYCLISFFTFIMGTLHNGKLLVMPLYFLALSLIGLFVERSLLPFRGRWLFTSKA